MCYDNIPHQCDGKIKVFVYGALSMVQGEHFSVAGSRNRDSGRFLVCGVLCFVATVHARESLAA